MKEYEYRRAVFYQLNGHKSFEDAHKNFDYKIVKSDVAKDAADYLIDGSSYLRFPGAARATAISAAAFVSKEFGEDFYTILNDPNLMSGNDPFFKRYSEDKKTYDEVLRAVEVSSINWQSYRMNITLEFLREEYMLDEKGLGLLPRSEWKK